MLTLPESLIHIAGFSPLSMRFPYSWCGHLPFAAWLIRTYSPRVFVELGTHSGNSYFTFCQAVKAACLPTRCYAVDTWQGDEHAGQYGEDIFKMVSAHNQEHYAGFSTLLRQTFDDASGYFNDGSIGLLHIDGLHTYEAVRHDFETWLPKLAPDGVVLFHDINVRERGFGVWRLWEELCASHPWHLAFAHSYGLGVLRLGNGYLHEGEAWLEPGSVAQAQVIDYFSALGLNQIDRAEVFTVRSGIAERDAQLAERDAQLADRDAQIANLNLIVADRDAQIVDTIQHISAQHAEIAALLQSRSWKITRPMRQIGALTRKLLMRRNR